MAQDSDQNVELPENVDEQVLQNIEQLLQQQPESYLHFGAWWWGLKRILKKHGYTQANLAILGPYEDHDVRVDEMLAGRSETEIMDEALAIQEWAARYAHHVRDVYWPDGEPYHLIDQDAPI